VRKRSGEIYVLAGAAQDQEFGAIAESNIHGGTLAGPVDRNRLYCAGLDGGLAESEAGDRAIGSRRNSLRGSANDHKKGKGLFAHVAPRSDDVLSHLAQQIYHHRTVMRI
jgi:hypothetical protein